MNLTLIQLAIEQLNRKVELLEENNKRLEQELNELRNQKPVQIEAAPPEPDELIDMKEVLTILGVCYNTLRAIIEKGLLKPIRINQRRIRFSKKAVLEYIASC